MAATPVRAGGFQVRPGSPDWAANAFAGMAAKGYDASTAWSNPAAMTRLDRSEIDLGVSVASLSIGFQGQDLVGGQPVAGSSGGNAGRTVVLPSFAAVWAATPDLRLGVAVETPFGQRTVWPGDFVGRYQALVSSISDTEIGFAVAYRLTPTLSIGAGPIIDHFEARLTSAINTGPLAAIAGDPVFDVHGDSWAPGYHLGVLWQPTAALRFGLDYRSRIAEDLHGSQQVYVPAALAAFDPEVAVALASLDQSARTRITLPDVLTASAAWEISHGLTALATVQWTHWSLINAVNIKGSQGSTTVLPLDFHDSWLGSVGLNVRPPSVPRLLLQGGVGFESAPVTRGNRTPQLPDFNTVLVGVGLTYDVSRNLRVQAAYLHEFGIGDGANSFSTSPSAGVLTGSYSLSVDVFSLGLAWKI
ncbi:MAG: OmpP1/FadL family transporter [Acetobacteraceae bacterium]